MAAASLRWDAIMADMTSCNQKALLKYCVCRGMKQVTVSVGFSELCGCMRVVCRYCEISPAIVYSQVNKSAYPHIFYFKVDFN